jgi:uncharacterized protein
LTAGTLQTSDGIALAGRTWRGHDSARAAVVLAHGFSASKDEAAVVTVAEALQQAGLHVISYDARGHGDSGGECTLGDLERLDVAAGVEAALAHSPRVVLVGASMGAIAVLRYAAGHPGLAGLDGVVSVSSPSAWRVPRTPASLLAAGATRTALGRRLLANRLGLRIASKWTNPEPPRRLAARITAPLAVVHGRRDRFISFREGVELHRFAAGPRRLELVAGMGHAFDPLAIPVIVRCVDWCLAESGEHG